MLPYRESSPVGRRSVLVLRWVLLVLFVAVTITTVPRPLRAQMPPTAVVVANVARWMAQWLGQYLLGRGVDFALERVRGATFKRQLQQVERTLRNQMSTNRSARPRLTRELRLVQNQIRLIDGATKRSFTRDSARVYYGKVNDDIDELRDLVHSVASSVDTAWVAIAEMQREIEDLREEVSELRTGRRVRTDDEGNVELQGEAVSALAGLPSLGGLRVGLGYAASQFDFRVPAYGSVSASDLKRRQQGAAVRVGLDGGPFQLGLSASALGAWLDSTTRRMTNSEEPATRQPLQTVTIGADAALALAPSRWVIRPLIGAAAEQVWMSFRNLPGVSQPDVVFNGLVYGPQAGLDLRFAPGFSLTVMARAMKGQLRVPAHQMPTLHDTRSMTNLRRNQITAVLSYKEVQ
jgi:hypothetical protein